YSTDGGTTWTAVGAVSDSSALLLRSSDSLRFVPDGLNGTTASVTFRAWDQTTGTAGAMADASTNGGSTAFSAASATSSIAVTAVNDAPTVTIAQASYSATEQTTLALQGTGLSIADVDAGSTNVQVTVSVTAGTLSATAGSTGVSIAGSGTSTLTFTGK